MNRDIAEVIVNISVDALDRAFEYRIPEALQGRITEGTPVAIPFGRGNRELTGYVVAIKEESEWDRDKMKDILRVQEGDIPVEGQLLSLAAWIREHYGSTMNEAIRTVLPIREKVKSVEEHWLNFVISEDEAERYAEEAEAKHHIAKARLIRGLLQDKVLSTRVARDRYKATKAVVDSLVEAGVIEVVDERIERRPEEVAGYHHRSLAAVELTEEQDAAVQTFLSDYTAGERHTYLLYGVTGSGKTEVYMEMLRRVIDDGRQAIVLIPEISLTHQTVDRFAAQFGDRVTVIHSRMSAGERYDQFMRAKNHEVDIVVGPRSALFVPFDRLGLIVMDEEHDGSYQSDKSPTYHAREVAIERAARAGAAVVLGSATPSVETYLAAKEGRYKTLRLMRRATGASLPQVHVVDLRKELEAKNYSIFSRLLAEKIEKRIEKHEQTMLFINRRGYAGFVSCRSCGYVIKCPHCDVSMTEHGRKNNPHLVCHYCGHVERMPKTCPSCGSGYIASFGLGTEQVCEMVAQRFPSARVLRMDADTTKNKGGHERVLAPFRKEQADILVGTQMIVKGHDLPKVTLVGAIAADMSLFQSDFQSYEKTFELLMQAGGRAGRADLPGEFVIQTYQPESYCIEAIRKNDPDAFYEQEFMFRRMSGYPPFRSLLKILISSENQDRARELVEAVAARIDRLALPDVTRIGPAPDRLSFIKDRYRMSLFIKSGDPTYIDTIIRTIEEDEELEPLKRNCYISYGRSPR
ncbi:MAG: primosomal protein N' [Eubacterium sp.]|nr:primosomal protein N' [Eubacterium sp.]